MKLFHASEHPPHPVDPQRFTGEATMAMMKDLGESPQVNMYRVERWAAALAGYRGHLPRAEGR
jgi:hypothetical protein